ncbi:hypothetical protein L1987_07431 [Smallanthus sonchifolius]|uniref:Uncharacterized protein n=1 Tax=Smallanthus sonchifolius TaxID=185202 RepID=A0ACB9K0N7_9ASTR|nr:hypothetical protein L1987_07431 [Smallanthus sonchifolius]
MTHQEATGKITQVGRRIVRLDVRWSVLLQKISIFRELFRVIWERFLACSIRKPVRYRRLSRRKSFPVEEPDVENPATTCNGYETDSDLIKYIGDEKESGSLEMAGLNLMDKTLSFGGARIAFNIWDVGGDRKSNDQVPIACKDAVAIFVLGWYMQARKWNKTAIPVLIGTKFDDFVRLPPDLQWTIVSQSS